MGERRGGTVPALLFMTLVMALLAACTSGTPRAVPPGAPGDGPTATPSGDRVVPPPEPPSATRHRPRTVAAESPGPWATGPPASPVPSPAPSPGVDDWWARQQHDGRPGWSTGFGGCYVAGALPERGTPPFKSGIALRLEAPATFEAGRSYTVQAVVTNTGGRYVHFAIAVNWALHAVLLDDAGHGSLVDWGDAISREFVDLGPGEETSLDVTLDTSSCGDGQRDPSPPLPKGTYRLGFGVAWSERAAGPSPTPLPEEGRYASGEWGIAPLTVQVI
jgi:hypothetical protein